MHQWIGVGISSRVNLLQTAQAYWRVPQLKMAVTNPTSYRMHRHESKVRHFVFQFSTLINKAREVYRISQSKLTSRQLEESTVYLVVWSVYCSWLQIENENGNEITRNKRLSCYEWKRNRQWWILQFLQTLVVNSTSIDSFRFLDNMGRKFSSQVKWQFII